MATRHLELWHLTKRFFSSLRPRSVSSSEEEWLVAMLSPAEEQLYRAQSPADRRHSIDCALAARSLLGAHAAHHVVVASALHDVGKADSRMGTIGRVLATVVAKLVPDRVIGQWDQLGGVRGHIGRYARHDVRGAVMLMAAGSHPMVVAWAREHHEKPGMWSVERTIADTLLKADR